MTAVRTVSAVPIESSRAAMVSPGATRKVTTLPSVPPGRIGWYAWRPLAGFAYGSPITAVMLSGASNVVRVPGTLLYSAIPGWRMYTQAVWVTYPALATLT